MAQFLQQTSQDHHENWTSNQLLVPFPTVHEQEARSKDIDIMTREMDV